MDCFKNFVTKFINEATTKEELGFEDKDSANVFYYIGRYIENKGPQTEGTIKKYLDTKFNNEIPDVKVYDDNYIETWEELLSKYFHKDGRKWDFTDDTHKWWKAVAEWHDANAEEEDPNAYYVKMFWDWYRNEKKAKPDNYRNPSNELIEFIDNSTDEELQKAFGKYYKFAMGQLQEYFGDNLGLTEEDKLIQNFWDWHRAKKAGKPYQLDQATVDGLVTFLRKPKAVEVLQQYYYYFVRVIEKLSDKNIKTNQKQLKYYNNTTIILFVLLKNYLIRTLRLQLTQLAYRKNYRELWITWKMTIS